MKSKKIYLVGMPSSGKSTVGKFVATHFGLPFVDLDKIIIEKEGMEITEIFKKKGEDYFRVVERICLVNYIDSSEEFVMATGGGAPCFFDNMELMNNSGTTVFLEVSLDDLFIKLSAKGTNQRPLLKDLAKKELYNELQIKLQSRIKFYGQSKIRLVHNLDSISDRVNQVISALEALKKESAGNRKV